MSSEPLAGLARALEDPDAVVDSWLEAYRASVMRLPGPIEPNGLRSLMAPIVASLAEGVRGPEESIRETLDPGAPDLRELEKSVAFVGATLANSGASGFDVSALMQALRVALAGDPDTLAQIRTYMEWLTAVAVDSLALARANAERERIDQQLGDGMPLVQVVPELPAVLLVGEPTPAVMDSIYGRLVLLCVRVDAQSCILDATGLADQESPSVCASLERFLSHKRIAGRIEVLVAGVSGATKERWSSLAKAAECSIRFASAFDQAVEWGLQAAGYRLLK